MAWVLHASHSVQHGPMDKQICNIDSIIVNHIGGKEIQIIEAAQQQPINNALRASSQPMVGSP